MSSNRRRLPGYLLHKPTGQARVRLNGHDHYLGVYDSPASWERYHHLLAARKSPGAIITAPAPTNVVTITELCAAYLEWARGYYVKNGRATSQVAVIRMSLRALRKLYGETMASQFGPLAFEALQKSLVDEGRNRS